MPTIPPDVQRLIDEYQKAQLRLIDIIAKQEAKGNVTSYRRAIMNQVNAELSMLTKYSNDWSADYIPKVYRQSVDKLYRIYKEAGIEVPEVPLNRRAINLIVENTSGLLEEANKHLGRILDDEIRKAGVQATAEKLSVGDTVKQMKQNLVGKLADEGLNAVTYRNGKQVSLDAYAELVARSTTRETTNRATMQHMSDIGQDLVQMSSHNSSCPVCATYEGRVYSVSGKDRRYPKLEAAFGDTYANIHPNCGHVITPYIEKFDDNPADTREFSNRSFNVDPRSQAQIDRYNNIQAAKAAMRRDRNQYEAAKLAAPKSAPKTFSAFRNMKKANSPKYQELQQAVRQAKSEA